MTTRAALAPIWLRPVALCAFGAVHAALVMALPGTMPVPGAAGRTIELEIIAPPEEVLPNEPASDAAPPLNELEPAPVAPQVALLIPPPPEVPPPELPRRDPVVMSEPAEIVPALSLPEPPEPVDLKPPAVENREAIPLVSPSPIPVPKQQPPVQARKEAPAPRRKQETSAPRSTDKLARPAAPSPPRATSPGSAAASPGYSARVRGILQARANALAIEDADGVVGIAFVIASNGRLASFSITRPSGNFQIDRAIRAMLGSISFPPPPGGQYSGSVSVRVR